MTEVPSLVRHRGNMKFLAPEDRTEPDASVFSPVWPAETSKLPYFFFFYIKKKNFLEV